jgi:hypothetical protein
LNDAEKAFLGAVAPIAAQFTADLLRGKYGTPKEALQDLLGVSDRLIPRAELIAYLTDEGRVAGEIAADIAEREKWPNE